MISDLATVTYFQAMTMAIAAVGAVLGVINTWRAVDQNRVKLKVVPTHAIAVGAANPNIRFCVQVSNLSQFAVTFDDAGVLYHGTKNRCSIVAPIFTDNEAWPRRLESRTSVSIYSQLPFSSTGRKIKCAYVRTQCGRTKTGTSPALRQIANAAMQRGEST
jgi:hypothetical protein